jgi:anti-sigma-K factor RskA
MTGPEDGTPTADDALALDWALGALGSAECAAAEARRQADPAFARLCDQWAAELLPLADEVEGVAPSPGLWERIEAGISPPAPAPAALPQRTAWWNSLGLWRGASAALAALALALLLTRPPAAPVPAPAPPQAQLLAATLSAEGGAPLATAALDAGRSAVLVSPVGGGDLQGRVPELWLIPADGRPRSLGVISLGGVQQVKLPPTLLKLVADGAVLAVSLEPAGGSPTGLPTGPVVATGKLLRL